MKKKFLKILAISSLMLTAGGVIAYNGFVNGNNEMVQRAEAATTTYNWFDGTDANAVRPTDQSIDPVSGLTVNLHGYSVANSSGSATNNTYNIQKILKAGGSTGGSRNINFVVPTGYTATVELAAISNSSSGVRSYYVATAQNKTPSSMGTIYLTVSPNGYEYAYGTSEVLSAGTYYINCDASANLGFVKFHMTPTKALTALSVTSDAPATGLYFGETANLTVTGAYDDGSQEAVTPENASWSSDYPTLVSVNNNVVEVIDTPEVDTTVTLTLNYDGQIQTTTILVKTDALNAIAVSSVKTDVYYEETANLIVTGTFVSGNTADVTETITEWVVSDPALVAVNNGVVSVLANPEVDTPVTITAKSETLENSVTLNIKRNVAESIALDASTATLSIGETKELVVTATKTNGATSAVSAELVTWESSNPAVASVEKGVVTALAKSEEPVTITATYEGHTATCTLEKVASASFQFDMGVDTISADPIVMGEYYYVNGYTMKVNKEVSKSYNSNSYTGSQAAQVGDITFTPEYDGTLRIYYKETGKGKDRNLVVTDLTTNVEVGRNNGSSSEADLFYEVNLSANHQYKVVNVENSDGVTETMINLFKLEYQEIVQPVIQYTVKCGYQLTDEKADMTKDMRVVGAIKNYQLEDIASVGFEFHNTVTGETVKRYTTDILTSIIVDGVEETAAANDADYIFAFIIEGVSADNIGTISFRSYVQLKDGTMSYSAETYTVAEYNPAAAL